MRAESQLGTEVSHSARVVATRILPALLLLGATALAQDAAADFRQNCMSCHTIGGGRLTGPDLKDVTKRKDRAWLVRYITDPAAMIASGDPYILKLLEEARNVVMPNVPGMSPARAEALLDLIEAESQLEKSHFAGVQLSDRPFTPADVALGRLLFLGREKLTNGGAACNSCHSVGGLGGLGGGRLGPDLTKVFEKYEDRRKLGAWLSAPATPTMQPTFRDHPLEAEEILPLVAFLQDTASNEEPDESPRALVLVLCGLAGAAGVLVLCNGIWKERFRGVRRPLVRQAQLPRGGA